MSGIEPLTEIACPYCQAAFSVHILLGHFQLLNCAGKGGMGVVYRAFDSELNREVALKLLKHEQSSDPELVAKLASEAAVTARINHPNVVRVFSTGVAAGRFFIAMELVNKGSLDELIRTQGMVSEAQALLVGMQAAAGLRAAQEHGLIHRDIKPANILFATRELAKLVDFGLAISQSEEESVRGEIWGTPHYIAPEKIEGKPEDFRSDIYSLGGTLFHAMTGRPPFDGPNSSTIALKHLQSPAVRIQSFAPHVSKRTAYVIDRMLHKDPEQRYQSYDELIEHLQYAHNELFQTSAHSPKPAPLVVDAPAENRAASWFTGAAISLLLIGFFFRGYLFQSPSKTAENSDPDPLSLAYSQIAECAYTPATQTLLKTLGETGISDAVRLKALFLLCVLEASPESKNGNAHPFQLRELASKVPQTQFLFGPALGEAATTFLPNSPALDLSEIKPNDPRSVILLATGINQWSDGKLEDAIVSFRNFRLRAPAKEDPWMKSLFKICGQYSDSLESFELLQANFKSAKWDIDRAAIAAALRDFPAPFSQKKANISGLAAIRDSSKTHIASRRFIRVLDRIEKPSPHFVPTAGLWQFQNQAVCGSVPQGSAEPARLAYRRSYPNALANTELFAPVKTRKLRFVIHKSNSSEPPAIDEIQVFDPSGKNIATLSEGTSASASGFESDQDDPTRFSPAKAIDGKGGTTSVWLSERTPAWFQLDFTEEKEISRIVWSRDCEGQNNDRVPFDYQIETGNIPDAPSLLVRCNEIPTPLDLGDFVAEWSILLSEGATAQFRVESPKNTLLQASFTSDSASLETSQRSPTLLRAPANIKPDSWHVCVLEVIGARVAISIDGQLLGSASLPSLAAPKPLFSFLVSKGSARFKNVFVWQAVPRP